MPFEREEDLYPPVKAFLEGQGYEVKSEVRGCDIVARRGAEPPVIVELKLSLTLPLLLQGIDRLALSDHVYLAVGVAARPGRGSLWRRERRGILRLCRRLGLGLLAIHEPTARTRTLVEPLLDPLPYRPRPDRRRQGLLLKEFVQRVGDPNVGGTTRRPIVTVYRQAALGCAAHLGRHGPTKASEVAKATDVSHAAVIMRRDVYGWFERVERGVYALTPRGVEALQAHAGVLADLEAARSSAQPPSPAPLTSLTGSPAVRTAPGDR